MSTYITVKNRSTFPINCALSWGGVQQQHRNNIEPDTNHSFPVGLGWHDLTIATATNAGANGFDAKRDGDITESFLVQAIFKVFSPANPNPLPGDIRGALPLGKDGGAVKVNADSVADIELLPMMIKGIYAPDANTVTVTGNEVDWIWDETTEDVRITAISPLKADCYNHTAKSTASYSA